jgi:hypothetical protein
MWTFTRVRRSRVLSCEEGKRISIIEWVNAGGQEDKRTGREKRVK